MRYLVLLTALLYFSPADARPGPQWAAVDPIISKWFYSLMQPDNPAQSCCGEADAFEVDDFEVQGDQYVAIITDGKGMIANGTRVPVPNVKMKWDQGNPTGHGVIFLSGAVTVRDGQRYYYVVVQGLAGLETRILYCFVPPGGV